MAEVAAFTRRRLGGLVDDALRKAGVHGVVPTPLEPVMAVAGLPAPLPMPALPDDVRTPGRRLLGALWFEERTMFLDARQGAARRRFTQAHELVHALCPWHEAALREDTAVELSADAADAVEAEANAGAGLLIFQPADFAAHVAGRRPTIALGGELAERYDASRHAALHHLVVTHDDPVALVVAGRFPLRDGSLPVWRSLESRSFRARWGAAAAHLPGGIPAGGALRELVASARGARDAPSALVPLGRRLPRCAVEVHDNRHATLLLVLPEAARGARAAAA